MTVLGATDSRGDELASSTFDIDDEGWRIFFRDERFVPQYIDRGGNPGGYVSGEDRRIGQRWFWEAPEKFLGNMAIAYGDELSFDLFQIRGKGPGLLLTQMDVVLNRGGTSLSYNDPQDPGEGWTEYAIPLLEAGWRNETTGLPATEDDMLFVLGGIEQMLLRGDYSGGFEVGGLDNVILTPEPLSLILLCGLVLRFSRRRPHNTIARAD